MRRCSSSSRTMHLRLRLRMARSIVTFFFSLLAAR